MSYEQFLNEMGLKGELASVSWRATEGIDPFSLYFVVDMKREFNKNTLRQVYLENYVWKNRLSAEEVEIFVQYFAWAGQLGNFSEYRALINSQIPEWVIV